MAITTISPAPVGEPFFKNSMAWLDYFNRVFRMLQSLSFSVSPDNGNADMTAVMLTDASTLYFNTPLTAARTVTLSGTNAFNGARVRVVRGAGATGAFNLNVGAGPLKALTAAGQWCDVEYNGTAWVLTAYGSL